MEEKDYQFAFVVVQDNDGNLKVRSLKEGETVSAEDIYHSCSTIIRNHQAQEIASIVIGQMMQAAAATQNNQSGLILPKIG